MAYTVDDLIHHCGFSATRVEEILEPLVASDILRVRQRGVVRYELRHDAFIRVLRPWMAVVKNRIKARQRLRRIGVAALAALVIVGLPAAAMYYQKKESFDARTIGRLESLRKEVIPPAQAELVFDDVFGFMVSADPEGESDQELAGLLREYESELPEGYGVYQSGLEHVRFPKNRGYWPLALHHAPDRKISRAHLQLHWNVLVQQFADRWGVPLPRGVRLKQSDALARNELLLLSPDVDGVAFDGEDYRGVTVAVEAAAVEDLPYIAEADLTERAKLFLKGFASATPGPWGPVPYLEEGSFRSVPRWSLPVWTVTGGRARDGAGALAQLVGDQILANPSLVLMPAIVDTLLRRIADIRPMVVREARIARGRNLPSDLGELLKRGRSIKDLEKILDELANHPDGDSAAVAREVDGAMDDKVPSVATRARGPWDRLGKHSASDAEVQQPEDPPALMGAYEEGFYWLSGRKLPIRIFLGADVEAEIMSDRRASDQSRNAISAARRAFTERYGVRFPWVKLYEHDALGSGNLASDQFRIEVVTESASDPGAAPVTPEAGRRLDSILQTLATRASSFRMHWLDPDEVERLRGAQLLAATRSWIDQHYSLTDLKHLMQRVLAPSANGSGSSPDNTLGHLDWLLRSLGFWAEVDDINDLASLAQRLRDTQRARLAPSESTPAQDDVARNVEAGIRELGAGNFGLASVAFKRAVRKDRDAATTAFLKGYSRNLELSLREKYLAMCQYAKPSNAWWQQYPSLTFEDQADFLAYAEHAEDAAFGKSLRVCAAASILGPQRETERREIVAALIEADSDLASWLPAEAAALAKRVLIEGDAGETRDRAESLLAAAVAGWPLAQAEGAFEQVAKHDCGGQGEKAEDDCIVLLGKLVAARPDSEKMPNILATRLSAPGE